MLNKTRYIKRLTLFPLNLDAKYMVAVAFHDVFRAVLSFLFIFVGFFFLATPCGL